jgi:riboflavin synthase
MFSGIVETQARVLEVRSGESSQTALLRIVLSRPSQFADLHIGDSVAVNGVCLTIESFDVERVTFALGNETLKITGWTANSLQGAALNLERSLRLGDRIHGHMVSGHVDATGTVESVRDLGGSVGLDVGCSESLRSFVWPKGSWAVNGVSLTINEVKGDVVSMCLIPETLNRTNLGALQQGMHVNLEVDMVARGLVNYFSTYHISSQASFQTSSGRVP